MTDPISYSPDPLSGPDTEAEREALQALLNRTVDAKAGFDTMREKAEPEFRPVVQKFHGTHHAHTDQIAALIAARGGEPDVSGTLMSSVNTAVVSIRALFDEIDEDVMDSIRDGEGHVLEAFDEAIAAMTEGHDKGALVRMRGEIQDLLDETRHLD
ncbi:DUF2383 domain-containing protein [Rhodophyticola sp.]|jgi:uncharacterized protein (TIGR02284 family)|uniref:DUF2383 domain-containing protein n=1 Tax=Rhodophyticola sp. TaxID=2680032 RepID=UPI003D2BA849